MKKEFRNSIDEVRAVKENLAKNAGYQIEAIMALCRGAGKGFKGPKLRVPLHHLKTGTNG